MMDKNKLIGFFGIGIFTYLSISNFTYFVGDILKDLLIFLDLNPMWIFFSSELMRFFLFVLLINYVILLVFNNHEAIGNNIIKYFIWSFSTYFILQIIQTSYPPLTSYLETETSIEGISKYYKFLKQNYMLYFLQSILFYFGEIIAVLLIYNKIKKTDN